MRWIVGATLALVGCAEFVDPTLGVCGNRIIESGENCDDPDDPRCGPAGEASACRWLCDESEACETGYSCGNDGVCRTPREAFDGDAIDLDELGARWIEVGDIDGDGTDDLLVVFVEPDGKDAKAIYVDGDGAVEIVELVEPAIVLGTLGDLTGDGLADTLLVPESPPLPEEGVGLSLWRGNPERAPIHSYFATLRTDGPHGRLLAASVDDHAVLELLDDASTRKWSPEERSAIEIDPLGVSAAGLGASIGVADLNGGECEAAEPGPAVGRNEVAFASEGDDRVRIASVCGTAVDFVSDATLPEGNALSDAGAFFAFADAGDQELDLFTQDDDGAIWVALGVGDGTFQPFTQLAEVEERLLAVGDFDGDGLAELATESDYLAEPEVCSDGDSCARLEWPVELEYAAAVDINGDGALDVAGVSEDILSIHLGQPLRDVPFETHELEQPGEARVIAVGDYDHDTVPDLAITVFEDDSPPGADETITVLYGGSVHNWRQENYGPFAHIQTLVTTGGDTLVARVTDESGRAAGAFIQPGEAEYDFGVVPRFLLTVRVPDGLAVAGVIAEPDGDVLAHFGFVDGALSPHDVTRGDPLEADGFHVAATAIDVNGDSLDELLLLGPDGRAWVAELEAGRWRITDAVDVAAAFARRPVDGLELGLTHGPPGGGPGTIVLVVDVDGDGDDDALATTDEPSPRVAILFNDGARLGNKTRFVTSPTFELAQLSAWHRDTDGEPRFLVGGADGVAVMRLPPNGDTVDLSLVEDTPAQAIATADLDGDGLLDLVVGSLEETHVVFARERI